MKNKTRLDNNKGALFGVIMALAIMCVGAIVYIITSIILQGSAPNEGLFYMAETQWNVNNSSGSVYDTIKHTWEWAPLLLVVVGIIYALVATQREEYYRYPR